MALISLLSLRRDPRILKLPPYVSALCIIIGVVWLFLLPLDEYSRHTYISENALLPGQVHTYFGGSEENIFRAYKHEVVGWAEKETGEVVDELGDIFRQAGLKVARQKYEYTSSGETLTGENVYSILHAPRGDATEAIVLVAAWRNMDGKLNQGGVALLLTLARYFKRWSLWSKDIIFLVTSESRAGPQAWVDAYHDAHAAPSVASLPIKSGALQGVVVVDYAMDHRYGELHIVYDGINGQLPNLDLFNTAVAIANGQMGQGVTLQRMHGHTNSYKDRLKTMLRGMVNQGLGHASGPHSSFIPYHIDAITLQATGEGWQDEMAMGRSVESIFRSLNNLLEHFHQSFFFYLLMQTNRFVSIGTYLPSAMLVAASFTIMAIALWIQSGRPPPPSKDTTTTQPPPADAGEKKAARVSAKAKATDFEVIEKDGDIALIPTQALSTVERKMFLPLAFVISVHFLGVVPLYIFNHTPSSSLAPTFLLFTVLNALLPHLLPALLALSPITPTAQTHLLIRSFALLLLGMSLSTLATLNFSLSLLIGLLSSPLILAAPSRAPSSPVLPLRLAKMALLHALSPPVVVWLACWASGVAVGDVLREAAFGWRVWGMWTQVVGWCVWWPAWVVGGVLVSSSIEGVRESDDVEVKEKKEK